MNKILGTVLLTILMSGCICIDTPNYMQLSKDKIKFEAPVIAKRTKAPYTTDRYALYGTTYPTNWNFAVEAKYSFNSFESWYLSDDFFDCQEVVFDSSIGTSGAWTTTDPKYWPKAGYLHFLAYSPANTDKAIIGNSGVKFGESSDQYVVATDGTQVDLMYSSPIIDCQKSSVAPGISYPDGIQVPFHHALSLICFTVKTAEAYEGVTVKLTGISLLGMKGKGYFDQMMSGDGRTSSPVWITTGPNSTVYGNILDQDIVITDTKINLWENEHVQDLLVLPQNFTDDVLLTIGYAVKQPGLVEERYQTFQTLNELTYKISGADVEMPGFLIGRKYTYNITIHLDKIYFSPDVVDWIPVDISKEL